MLRGHAIECRINAEDASKNFAPAPGRIGRYREPTGPGVRVDSGVGEGGEVSPMYDPMVAKLIVWDADREQATRRMLRALVGIRDRGAEDADPVPQALLATEQWARGETCRDLLEDRAWLKTLAFETPQKERGTTDPAAEQELEKVEQSYTVEVSGRRFDVKVVGPPFAGAASRRGRAERIGRRAARKPQTRAERKSAAAGGPDTLPSPLQGNMWKVLVKQGDTVAGGPAAVHHRGDEDGERDHRPQGGRDRRAADHRGRPDRSGRPDRDDQEQHLVGRVAEPRARSSMVGGVGRRAMSGSMPVRSTH